MGGLGRGGRGLMLGGRSIECVVDVNNETACVLFF